MLFRSHDGHTVVRDFVPLWNRVLCVSARETNGYWGPSAEERVIEQFPCFARGTIRTEEQGNTSVGYLSVIKWVRRARYRGYSQHMATVGARLPAPALVERLCDCGNSLDLGLKFVRVNDGFPGEMGDC